MKIRFELTEDLYLLVDWNGPVLPQVGDSIMLKDFIEKDESNLFYGYKRQIAALSSNRFKSFKEWNREELFAKEIDEIRTALRDVKERTGEYASIINNPRWEKKDGEIILVLELNFVTTGLFAEGISLY